MAADDFRTIKITSEEIAWDTLKKILNDELSADKIGLDFTGASWAKFDLRITGNDFDQTITPSIMKGLIDLQSSFYRSVALIVKNDADIRRLTDEEKKAFELIFKVEDGSSEILALLEKVLQDICGKVAEKMDKKAWLILILSLSLIFGTYKLGSLYFENTHNERMAEIQSKSELDKAKAASEGETARLKINAEKDAKFIATLEKMVDRSEEAKEKQKILADAAQVTDSVNVILNEGLNSYDQIIRQSLRADGIVLQGKQIGNDVIQVVRKTSRRNAVETEIKERFFVVSIDRIEEHNFQYGLVTVQGGREISAAITDRVFLARHGRVLRERLGDGKPILITVKGRQIGDDLLDAEIHKVTIERSRKAKEE